MYLPFFQCRFKAWYKFYLFELTNQLSNYIGYTLLLIECTHPCENRQLCQIVRKTCSEEISADLFCTTTYQIAFCLCASFISLITIQKIRAKNTK